MSRWLDRIFTRRPEAFCFGDLPPRVCRRLLPAFRELTKEEAALQARMGLIARPCLLVIDEEMAAIVSPTRRARMEAEESP